jgi:hypothetical protein
MFGTYISSNSNRSSNRNSIKSIPTILGTMEAVAPAASTTVVSAPAAQFLGSFAADSRQDHRKPAAKQDIKSIVQHYFTEGWSDISIWKSAVSANFLSECETPVPQIDTAAGSKMPQFSRESLIL